MVLLLFVLLINTCVLIGWGKYLNYAGNLSVNEKNDYRMFWFVTTGSILSSLCFYKFYPVWNNIMGGLLGEYRVENPFVQNFLILGPVKEIIKFTAFVTLAAFFKSIKKPGEAIIQAVSIALGFALAENFNNAMTFGIDNLIYSSFFVTLGHITFAAIWGFAWGYVVCTWNNRNKLSGRYHPVPQNVPLNVLVIALALVIAWVFHGSYNSLLTSGRYLFALLMDVSTIVLLYLIYGYIKERETKPLSTFVIRYPAVLQRISLYHK